MIIVFMINFFDGLTPFRCNLFKNIDLFPIQITTRRRTLAGLIFLCYILSGTVMPNKPIAFLMALAIDSDNATLNFSLDGSASLNMGMF